MAKGFDLLHVKSAVQSRGKFDLSRSHQTTLNFGQIIPIFHEELITGDEINVNPNIFSRCAPLVVPTFGKADIRTVSMFIPYYQVAKDADAFFDGQNVFNGVNVYQRYITLSDLFDIFNHESISYSVDPPSGWNVNSSNRSWYDFLYQSASNGNVYKKFSAYGKYVYKILRCLGYQIPNGVSLYSESTWMKSTKDIRLSAYPILAFFKGYNDWMSQSQNYNLSSLTAALYQIKLGNAYSSGSTVFYNGTGKITSACVLHFMSCLYLMYDNDYFTSAWRFPNSPLNTNNVTGIKYISTADQDRTVSSTQNVVSTRFAVSSNETVITQRGLDFLRKFDDWVRRNNYAGSRDVQQIYSRFGVKTDDFKSHFAYVLDKSTFPLQVGDVTSTAQTSVDSKTGGFEGNNLGDYAGKGIVNGSTNVHFKSSEFGMFITYAWISVKPVYADGFERTVLRNNVFDYFNPEFDGVGPDAISQMEVIADNKNDFNLSNMTSVYGFTDRYNSYKFGHDQITGDMAIYDDFKAWHFGRNLSAVRANNGLYAQSPSVMNFSSVSSEFNRIFQYTDGEEDMFYLTAYFDVSAVRPMKSLSQVADLGDGNMTIERNGNNIN